MVNGVFSMYSVTSPWKFICWGMRSGIWAYPTTPMASVTAMTGRYSKFHLSDTACGTGASPTTATDSWAAACQPRSFLYACTFARKYSMSP